MSWEWEDGKWLGLDVYADVYYDEEGGYMVESVYVDAPDGTDLLPYLNNEGRWALEAYWEEEAEKRAANRLAHNPFRDDD